MTFSRPEYVAAAVVVLPLLIWLYLTVGRRRRAQAFAFSDLAFVIDAMAPSRIPEALLFSAYALGTAALLCSLAGPHFVARIPAKDLSVIICIDTSGSMRAQDIAPTRADAARAAAEAFIDAVPSGTRVGIVTFASAASLVAAPTSDLDSVREALGRIPDPSGATAIGDALTLAAQSLPKTGRRTIVLLTDGVNNRGVDPQDAARAIGAQGVAIQTVGVGSSGSGTIIPGTNELADLDATALTQIASSGHGHYVETRDAGALRDAFRRIALGTVWETRRVDGSFAIALGGGLLLIVAFFTGLAVGKF